MDASGRLQTVSLMKKVSVLVDAITDETAIDDVKDLINA